MEDAGCDRKIITKICRMYADGQIQEAVQVLRRHRCHLMEQLHECQSKVDCLDFLVRQMQKQRSSLDVCGGEMYVMQEMQRKDGNV